MVCVLFKFFVKILSYYFFNKKNQILVVFAIIFKFLGDAIIHWRVTILGCIFTEKFENFDFESCNNIFTPEIKSIMLATKVLKSG